MREPAWWYGPAAEGWMPWLLAPLGWSYGALTARRMQKPPAYRANIPVVCIGNFTAGGTGKTPFVRVVVAALRAQGHAPVVLSRGYGGDVVGPHWVDVGRDSAAAVGDEPLLLADGVPVLVARDRAAGARAIETAQVVRATVIVMDDGLQNPALAKDLVIAVVDGVRGLGNGRCMPAGPLRAPLKAQVAGVDAVVLNGDSGEAGRAPLTPLLAGYSGAVLSARVAPAGDVAWLAGCPVIAYAGIGVPERFFATVAAAGGVIRNALSFGDHHAFSDDEARRFLAAAEAQQATLVTTEKDHARLRNRSGAVAALAAASRTLPIQLTLDVASADVLAHLIATRVPVTRP